MVILFTLVVAALYRGRKREALAVPSAFVGECAALY